MALFDLIASLKTFCPNTVTLGIGASSTQGIFEETVQS